LGLFFFIKHRYSFNTDTDFECLINILLFFFRKLVYLTCN